MLAAADVPEFQQAQRDLAREIYFTQAQKLAKQSGLKSERAHAMLFDAFVQRSPVTVRNAMTRAVASGGGEIEILRKFAKEVDEGTHPRRQNIFNSTAFSDAPMTGAGGKILLVSLLGLLLLKRFYGG
jgi:hypothetical protein